MDWAASASGLTQPGLIALSQAGKRRIKTMKTKILSILIGIGALACGDLFAQRMPQDSWYLFKQFRGDTEGGKFNSPRHASVDSSGNIYVADYGNHQIQVFDVNGNFLRKWGGYGTEPGRFMGPSGVHVSADNKVYVSEMEGDRVQVFDLLGKPLRAIGPFNNTQGQMGEASDVTTDSAGNIYVSDHQFHWIMVFAPNGTYLRQWGSYGSADGQFNYPQSLCFLPGDKIAVADTENHRVQIFNSAGTFLEKITNSGVWYDNTSMQRPVGVRGDSAGNLYVNEHWPDRVRIFNSSLGFVRRLGPSDIYQAEGDLNSFKDPYGVAVSSGKIFVPDSAQSRIAVYSSAGSKLTNVGSFGAREFQQPSGVAVDDSNNIFVSDHYNHRVAKFDSNGVFIKSFGAPGTNNAQFDYPAEMAIGPNQRLYVVEKGNHRVQVFDLNGNYVSKFGSYGTANGQLKSPLGIVTTSNRVYVSDSDNRRIAVFDLNGSFIKNIGSSGSFGAQFSDLSSLAILPDQTLVVSDLGNYRAQVLDLEGNFLRQFRSGYYWEGFSRIGSSSDGLLFGITHQSTLRLIDMLSLQSLKDWYNMDGGGGGRAAFGELNNGDLVMTGTDNLVKIFRRTYRTETPVTNNALPLPVVLKAGQRSGLKLVDLEYRVKDANDSAVSVAALAFNSGQNTLDDVILVKNFAEGTGVNVGSNIATGVTKKLTWDIAKDWGSDFGQLQMEVLAKDGRGLLNLDFIQMPAVGGDPLLRISRTPLNDSDFLSVWYWLLASGDSGIKLTYGKVFATNTATSFTYSGTNGRPGLVGSYYPYTNFTGTPTVVTNEFINIRGWQSGSSPDTPIRWDKISARWTGRLVASTNGNHTIFFNVDDSGKIFMNNSTNASLNRTSGGESSFTTNLTAGVAVPITIEYTDLGDYRTAQLYWTPPGGAKQLIPPRNLFTGVSGTGGTHSYHDPDATNFLASGTTTTAAGRTYILDKMGYREATTNEVLRAKYAGTPGTINQWDPKVQVGPGERPVKVNAYNFETSADGTWVVPK